MIGWIWKRIEPLVQAAITHRILKYDRSLMERGEIRPPDTEGPESDHLPPASLQPIGEDPIQAQV